MKSVTYLLTLLTIAFLLFLLPSSWLQAAPPATPLGAPCQAGGTYQPACDLDHDGDVDITDIQLAAGHWGQTGPYVETSWLLTGNPGTVPGPNYLGTTDNQALELRVNGQRALRLEPNATSPNLIGGYSANWLASGVSGATIGGGGTASYLNRVTDDYGTVGGGADNQAGDNAGTTADNPYATVGGGSGNTATGVWATVGGGYSNDATVAGATIGGGTANTAGAASATVGGGQLNTASGDRATIGGGSNNTAPAQHATVGGGLSNDATFLFATIAGGSDNTASGERATVGGGSDNTATALYATVGGGYSNDATVLYATIGGGVANTASGQAATVGGGQTNIASGESATVAGGRDNAAAGAFSLAAGFRAKANHTGCFVWADTTDADYVCSTDNQFAVRATGGVDFQTGAAALRVNGSTAWHAGNDGSGSGLDADLLDGQHGAAFQQKAGKVVVVAQSGGDFTSIQAALTSINGASDSNRYLVWVAPGVYTETVTMKPYVDIEGAGELLTTISSGGDAGTIVGANNTELRFLTVRNIGGVTSAYAIFNNSASPRLTHVTAIASGGTYNYGVYNYASSSPAMNSVTASATGGTSSYGVYNSSSAPTMTNVTASAWGGSYNYGVYNYASSSPTMTNVTATASGGTNNYGVFNSSSTPTIQSSTIRASDGTSNRGVYNSAASGSYTMKVNNCQVTGSTNTIVNDTEFTARIGASQLDGGPVTGGGTVTCAGVYDENYTFYASTCP